MSGSRGGLPIGRVAARIRRGVLFCRVSLLALGGAVPTGAVVWAAPEPDLPVVPPGLNKAYGLEIRRVRTVLATQTTTVRVKGVDAPREWLWVVARPPEHAGQRIRAFGTRPEGGMEADRSPLARPLWRVRVPVDGIWPEDGMQLVVKIRAELFSRKLVSAHTYGVAKPVALGPAERGHFLRAAGAFDHADPALGAWIRAKGLQRADDEGEVVFARRVFQFLAKGFQYEYLGAQDRRAAHVFAVGKSDCGGLSVLFATILRGQGIPARILAGRWAQPSKPGETVGGITYHQQHVIAEFYAQGIGWIPADVSSAVLHDRSPERLNHFGNDRGDFLTFHYDSDLAIDTGAFGVRTVDYLQSAAFWITGRGRPDTQTVENWEVESTPAK